MSDAQIRKVFKSIKEYRKKYLRKQYTELDESATRLMVNSFLTEVLGYQELEDIKTEYQIKGLYADYVVRIKRKRHFIVEVKAIQYDLNDKHLRQSIGYAANEGIDWILLTNDRQFSLYRVLFGKPIKEKLIFSVNLMLDQDIKRSPDFFYYLTKKSIIKNELEKYWKKCQALDPGELSRYICSELVLKYLRRELRKKTGINFSLDDLMNAVCTMISSPLEAPRSFIKVHKKKIDKPSIEASGEEIDPVSKD